MRVYVHEHDTE